MKKIFTTILMGVAGLSFVASAQSTLPERLDGYYRMTNEAFQEALTARNHYDIGATLPDPSNAGSVFRLKTDRMYSFAVEMEKLEKMLAEGQITQEQYMQMFLNLMNITSWKSGFFPIEEFKVQDVDYMDMLAKLPDIADDALENFLNTESSHIYNEYRGVLTFLCAVATDIIKPVNLETEASFRTWLENYLTKWRSVMDFGLYLHPVYSTPDDPEMAAEPTGEYYFEFKTPIYVGSMEKAQVYINNMLSNNGADPDAEQLDIWGTAKHYMMMEIEKEHPEGSDAWNFIHNLLGDSKMNTIYVVGETEEGGIRIYELPDAFNSQGVTITADDIARFTWKFNLVNESEPFAANILKNTKDAEGFHYGTLNLAFPVKILSDGMEVFTATAMDYDTSLPTLEKMIGDVIPANSPVIVRNKSAEYADNKLLPLDEETTPLAPGVLQGTLFPEPNKGNFIILGDADNGPRFSGWTNPVPANTAFYEGELAEIKSVVTDSESDAVIYDIFGRIVKDSSRKGIYIIKGKKIIK